MDKLLGLPPCNPLNSRFCNIYFNCRVIFARYKKTSSGYCLEEVNYFLIFPLLISRKTSCRIWHLCINCFYAGCRGFTGPVPPPLLIRKSSIYFFNHNIFSWQCQGDRKNKSKSLHEFFKNCSIF